MMDRLSPLHLAALRFRRKRGDYYEHLAEIIGATEGHKSLRDIFADDAVRYEGKPRGRLSRHWANTLEESGGNLATTFHGTLPDTDVAILAAVQETGGGNLAPGLLGLARLEQLRTSIRKITMPNAIIQWLAIGLVVSILAMLPLFLVPQMVDALPVPEDQYRGSAASIKAFAGWLETYGPPILLALLTGLILRGWVLTHLTGPWRSVLDRWGPFRQYRDLEAIQFLSTLSTILNPGANQQTGLRAALELMRGGAGPWLGAHLDQMMQRLDDAVTGPETFDTGLLDRDTYFFLQDVYDARGLDVALERTRLRVETSLLAGVERRSKLWRWVSLILAMLTVLAVFLWTRAAFDEVTSLLKSGLF